MKRRYLLAVAVLLFAGVVSQVRSEAKEVRHGELARVFAGMFCVDECDPTGAWQKCPGFNYAGYGCADTVADAGKVGYKCNPENATFIWAPAGDWNGQCEWEWFCSDNQHCKYLDNKIFCSKKKQGVCHTVEITKTAERSFEWMGLTISAGEQYVESSCHGVPPTSAGWADVTTDPDNNSRIGCLTYYTP